jgi:hypothetical protein
MVLGQPKRGAILFVSLPPQHAKQTAPIAAARREFIDQGAIGIAHRLAVPDRRQLLTRRAPATLVAFALEEFSRPSVMCHSRLPR